MLIQMAISRSREYDADAYSKRIPMDASPSTAHMFIIKLFSGQSFMRMFSTHPATEDRIARLRAMGRG